LQLVATSQFSHQFIRNVNSKVPVNQVSSYSTALERNTLTH